MTYDQMIDLQDMLDEVERKLGFDFAYDLLELIREIEQDAFENGFDKAT